MSKWDEAPLQSLIEFLEDPLKGTQATRHEVKNAIVHRVLDIEEAARERLEMFQARIEDLEGRLRQHED